MAGRYHFLSAVPLFDRGGRQFDDTEAVDCRRLVGQLLRYGRCCVVVVGGGVYVRGTKKRETFFWGRDRRHMVGKR